MYIIAHHYQVNFTFWHEVLLSTAYSLPSCLAWNCAFESTFLKKAFQRNKEQLITGKACCVSPLMFQLSNCNLFVRENTPTVPLVQPCTSSFSSAKWPNFNLPNLSISVPMGCHPRWQDACLFYQGAESNLIQDIFITKPQDPHQRAVMAVLRQEIDQLWTYQPNKNRQEHFLQPGYLVP